MAGLKRSRSELVRVGVFVSAALALLIGGILWLAGSSLLRPVARYTVVFEDSVSGLNPSASVQYQGVAIGRVADIRLTPDLPPKVAVDIEIRPGTPVRNDTKAQLLGSLVTGIKYIELTGGTAGSPALEPGGSIAGSTASLEQFRSQLTEIADRVLVILRRFDENLFTDENAREFGKMLGNLATVSDRLATAMDSFQTEKTVQDVSTLIRQMQQLADNVNAVVEDFYGRRDRIYGNLDQTLAELRRTITEGRKFLSDANNELSSAGGSVTDLIAALAGATARLQETIEVIQSDPSVLLYGRPIPEREFAK